MPSVKRQNRHPRTMSILQWSTPFFPPQKRRIASFLPAVNVGISTTPTTLIILRLNTPINILPIEAVSDDSTPLWSCPPVSPRSAGVVCYPPLWCKDDIPYKSGMQTNNNKPTTTLQDRFGTQPTLHATPSPAMELPFNHPKANPVLRTMPL